MSESDMDIDLIDTDKDGKEKEKTGRPLIMVSDYGYTKGYKWEYIDNIYCNYSFKINTNQS